MHDFTTTYIQSELDYRAARIRSGIGRRRHRRPTRARRPGEASNAR